MMVGESGSNFSFAKKSRKRRVESIRSDVNVARKLGADFSQERNLNSGVGLFVIMDGTVNSESGYITLVTANLFSECHETPSCS